MPSKANLLLVIVLLLVLGAVFFAPSVNLEPTALRAERAAAILFLAIFIASHFFAGPCPTLMFRKCGICAGENPNPTLDNPSGLIDLYCARLC